MDFNELRTVFLDLDRTVWNWDEFVFPADEVIESLKSSGKEVKYYTDNTRLSRQGYAEKLTSMGIDTDKEDIITSGYVVAQKLAEENITEAYVIGESGLIDELDEEDIRVSKDADVVVVGFDRQFSYDKLRRAFDILNEGGDLYVCSTEKTFHTSQKTMPHQKAFNNALSDFAEPENIGKPSNTFRRYFKRYFSYFNDKSMMVGDRKEDIELGNRLGLKTAAIMTGELSRDDLSELEGMQEPDFGLSNLNRLKRRIV